MIHADCGHIKLVKGEKGVTFTPHISEDGTFATLTFTNDGGLENPPPIKFLISGNTEIIEDNLASDNEVSDMLDDVFNGENSGEDNTGDNTESNDSDVSNEDVATDDEVNDMLEDVFGN